MNNNVPCIVRGVIEDLPSNCDFPIFTLASYETLRAYASLYFFREEEWGSISSNDQFFALLQDKNQFSAASSAMAQVGQHEVNERKKKRNLHTSFVLQSLGDMHYDEEVGSAGTHTISWSRLWVLGTIGLLVLLMACFNFINLATALSTMRAREVGVRKALGSNRNSLIAQFMTETSLIVAFSLAVGVGLAFVCAPLLKHISDVPDTQPFLSDPILWLFLAVIGVLVTLLSGFYPSLVLSGFSPIKALRSNLTTAKGGGVSLRKILVVSQFTIAQALIIGAVVTISQLNYIREMDLGFNKDLVLTTRFNADSTGLTKLATMKQRLLQVPKVEYVSFSSDLPASGNTWSSNFNIDRRPEEPDFHTSVKLCDEDYQKTFGLEMLAGHWFTASDTVKEYVVNETMCRKLGMAPEEIVGKVFRLGGQSWFPIVGVVKDFHSHSLHEEYEALTLLPNKTFYSGIGIKIRPGDISGTTNAIRSVYDETFPEQVFESEFFDESIANFYESESRFSDFCKGIAALAILIGCLGLFGLATHAAARRTKEIGVRKVLGASVGNITGLLTRDFLALVLLAILIATPLAYYFMDKWLSDFVFRIDMKWWMFAMACSGAVLVAFFTVSFQSLKAALANPVNSLRTE
ncbi:MAG: FtsX-like permease family protein [Saprospiraceae bacterium]